ncbi:MAG TPA: hypothetical protein VMQ50_03640 [Casimicrobiaceae bacterium]|nr:hypothetical protein [Casimicrobiaceae bacterium]
MEFDAWHHWLLLRPLIVFVLACPLLILAVLIGRRRDRRDAKRAREAEADAARAAEKDKVSRGYETASAARQTPRGWNGEAPEPRRRVA